MRHRPLGSGPQQPWRHRRRVGAVSAALVTLPAAAPTALAAAAQASPAGPPVWMTLTALFALATVALAFWVLLLRRRLEGREEALEAAAVRHSVLERLMASAPAGLLTWDAEGRERIGAGVAAQLGAKPEALRHLDQLGDFLQPQEFGVLRRDLEALRGEGTRFRRTLRLAEGAGAVRVTGAPPRRPGESPTVWFEDVREELARSLSAESERDSLRQTVHALRRLLAHAPFAVWERDAALALRWCNDAYARIVAAESAADAVERRLEIETSMLPDQAHIMAGKAQEAGQASETRFFVVDGQRRALRVSEVRTDEDTIVGAAQDITDLEEARAELRRHVDAHAEVLNNLNTAIAIFGPDRHLYFFNSAFARLWLLDEDWLASKPAHAEILDAVRENRMLPEQADYPAYKAGILSLYNNLLETQDGPFYLPNGQVLRRIIAPHPFGGLIFLLEDVTDRLTTERLYNTLIAVQRETLNNLYEGVALYGGDGRLKLYNPNFVQIWQLDERLLKSEPHVSDIVESTRELFDDRGDWKRLCDLLVSQVTGRTAKNGRMERPDGRVIEYAGVPLPDGNMLYTYLDVTDSARIERALRERNEALELADRLQSEFIANVSYELRTPLNVIMGFAEILSNEYFGSLNQRQKDYAEGILDSSQQLLGLINDILDLASIEAGQLEFETERFDLHVTLAGVLALIREQARKQKLYVSFDCAPDVGDIEGDERRIKQVVFNLLNNAVKYTPARGRITLGARRKGEAVTLWVQDTGIGISDEDQQAVFGMFQKGRNAARNRGAGLGLPLVRSFIEMHGGHVELHSQENVGTRIVCHLPVRQERGRLDDPSLRLSGGTML